MAAALAMLVPCVAQAQLTVSGTHLLWDGKPVFLRGAYYVQPAAYHHCFLTELDEKQLAPDFKAMRAAGLNCFCISVNWGDFIHSMDVAKGTFEWDRAVEKRFVRLLEAARRENMIVDLWFGTALDPVGVPGMTTGKPEKDFCGHLHKPAQGYLWPDYPGCAQFDDFPACSGTASPSSCAGPTTSSPPPTTTASSPSWTRSSSPPTSRPCAPPASTPCASPSTGETSSTAWTSPRAPSSGTAPSRSASFACSRPPTART